MKSSVAVKSIAGATTKGMKHHVKESLEDDSPDSIICDTLHDLVPFVQFKKREKHL